MDHRCPVPEPPLDFPDLIDGIHLERQMVQARPVRGKIAGALLPEGEEQSAILGQKGEALSLVRGFGHNLEPEHLLVKLPGAGEIADVESDVSGREAHGTLVGRCGGHGGPGVLPLKSQLDSKTCFFTCQLLYYW